MLLKANELIGGAAEKTLDFSQIRAEKALGTVGHFVSYNLPTITERPKTVQLTPPPDSLKDGFFSIDVQISEKIMIGLPFTMLLSISSTSPTGLKVHHR